MLKHLIALVAVLLLASLDSSADPALYSNGGLSPGDPVLATGVMASNGLPAPLGSQWSEAPAAGGAANAVIGFTAHSAATAGCYRVADDFSVPIPGFNWRISSIVFYAYQTDISPVASPITGINLRLWRGRPGDSGSVIVWGDTTTNRLLDSIQTTMYRVPNATVWPQPAWPNTSRAIWQVTAVTPGLVLGGGGYWLDWQFIVGDASRGASVPPVTAPGTRGKPGANARQLKAIGSAASWVNAIDPGKPASAPDVSQEFPFLIFGSDAGTTCSGDANGDGQVGFPDITSCLANWGASYSPNTGPGDANHNGGVNYFDIIAILVAWSTGCP